MLDSSRRMYRFERMGSRLGMTQFGCFFIRHRWSTAAVIATLGKGLQEGGKQVDAESIQPARKGMGKLLRRCGLGG